jgi:hypothetical protein
MNTLNKIMLQTAVSGLIWTAVVFCYGVGIFAVVFPGAMADFYDSVGNKNLSAKYYEQVFKNNPSDKNLYNALSKFITSGNDKKIIKYGGKFFAAESGVRTAVLDKVDEYLRSYAGNDTTALMHGCNEDNRLRCAYIRAILKRGGPGDFDKAKEIFSTAVDTVDFYRPSYAVLEFGRYIDGDIESKFREYYADFSAQYEEVDTVIPAASFFVNCVWFAEILV